MLIDLAVSTISVLASAGRTEPIRSLSERANCAKRSLTKQIGLRSFIYCNYCNQCRQDKGRAVSEELLSPATAASDTEMIGRARFWLGFRRYGPAIRSLHLRILIRPGACHRDRVALRNNLRRLAGHFSIACLLVLMGCGISGACSDAKRGILRIRSKFGLDGRSVSGTRLLS
jgi:hypothetical protein